MSKQDYRELESYRVLGKPEELVKVVRCKNCTHAIRPPERINAPPEMWLCLSLTRIVEENFYCDSGERRTDNG